VVDDNNACEGGGRADNVRANEGTARACVRLTRAKAASWRRHWWRCGGRRLGWSWIGVEEELVEAPTGVATLGSRMIELAEGGACRQRLKQNHLRNEGSVF
jgi:hypothetical protein